MLCCVSGDFGERYVQVGISNGKMVEKVEPPLGKPIQPDMLDEGLRKSPDVEAVAITYNETSVGLINPLPKLAEIVKKHGKLLFVDAVSAMGGVELKVDAWGIDVCFASSQKCFGIPPGLAIGAVSEEALHRSENALNKGWYFDFKLFERYQKQNSTPMTPAIPQTFALRKALEIAERNGKQSFFDLYMKRSLRIRHGLEKIGLTLFPEQGYESPTVTCANAPSDMSGPEIYKKMQGKGYELAQGYGRVREQTFRIGNMGYIPPEDIDSMLTALGELLTRA
jgi:aspartate aminotransferase-like enzyme